MMLFYSCILTSLGLFSIAMGIAAFPGYVSVPFESPPFMIIVGGLLLYMGLLSLPVYVNGIYDPEDSSSDVDSDDDMVAMRVPHRRQRTRLVE